MIALSRKWANRLATQKETGMGYQVATISLKDGRRFEHVTIIDGVLTSIRHHEEIPFVEDDIEAIEVNLGRGQVPESLN